jgi:capsular polysaccharide biosynthesis protein
MRAEASQYRVTRSALVSGRPVAPRIGRNVVIAGFLAALAAAFGILFVDAIRRYQSQ